MTHKWLTSDYDEAEEWLKDCLLSGDSYLKVDITTVLDGEVVDDLLRAVAKQNHDEVSRIMKGHVDRFLASEVGLRLIDFKASEIRQDRELNAAEWAAVSKDDAR